MIRHKTQERERERKKGERYLVTSAWVNCFTIAAALSALAEGRRSLISLPMGTANALAPSPANPPKPLLAADTELTVVVGSVEVMPDIPIPVLRVVLGVVLLRDTEELVNRVEVLLGATGATEPTEPTAPTLPPSALCTRLSVLCRLTVAGPALIVLPRSD